MAEKYEVKPISNKSRGPAGVSVPVGWVIVEKGGRLFFIREK